MNLQAMIRDLIVLAPPFLLAITLHELAHGYVATLLGDPTPRLAGRLTLNPVKHLDPFGVLCFVIMKIGWAKPVPVNANHFHNPRSGMLLVALAGPGTNLLLAMVSVLLVKLLALMSFLPLFILEPVAAMLVASIWINIMLAVFNLIPIPPLDGGHILEGLLPRDLAAVYAKMAPYGIIILLVLFYTGVISALMQPLMRLAHRLLVG